jgi:hypothetical protein
MNLTTITTWIKNNLLIAIIIGIAAIGLLFPKVLKGVFGTERRRRRRGTRIAGHSNVRRRVYHLRNTVSRVRTIGRLRRPGTRRHKGAKKPWQIKGSLAARRHMALIRKRR